jgi:hypothetical protein
MTSSRGKAHPGWRPQGLLLVSLAAVAVSAAALLSSSPPARAMSMNGGLSSAHKADAVVLVSDKRQRSRRHGGMGGVSAGQMMAIGATALQAVPPECINAVVDDNVFERWSCRARLRQAVQPVQPAWGGDPRW